VTGLLGGAFDPPHVGHVALADTAVLKLGLDRLVVVVVAHPAHKTIHASGLDRVELARAAFPGREVELDRHARTVDMLRAGRWDDPVFLIGADEFADFPRWKEPDAVLDLARLGVASRPGYPRERLDHVLSGLKRPERVQFFDIEPLPVSSTAIRERVAHGESIEGLVPPAVAAEIASRGLYNHLD